MKEIELKNLRKRREKHFLQENGEIVAMMYNDDIHFKKNGKYEEIDNTIIKENEYYTNTNNEYKVYFKEDSSNELMKIEEDNNYLEINLLDSNNVPIKKEKNISKLTDSVIYENILNGIDLEYKVLPTKVKENIIINNKESVVDTLNFLVNTDLDLVVNKDKSISAVKDSKTIFTIEAPYMIDSNNNINNSLYYVLAKYNNQYILNLNLDLEWLNNAVYPVVIDPTIINESKDNSVYDTYIYPGDSGVDRNSQEILKVGVEKVNGSDVINRALLKFDLPTIGTGSQVISAYFQLIGYYLKGGSVEHDIINVHRVTENWTEQSANWNSMNDKYDSRIESSFLSGRGFEYKGKYEFSYCGADITSLVKKWYSGLENNGVLLKANKEVYRSSVLPIFYSKDNKNPGDNPKPILVVSYRNQNGLENYMDYKVQSFTNGNSYINSYNGNLTTLFKLGNTIGGKLPASLSLVYNTNDVVLENDNGLGLGYKFDLYQTVKESSIDNYLEYLDADGTLHYFIKESLSYNSWGAGNPNKYVDEDGLNMTIEKLDSGYILTDKTGNTIKFIKNNNIGYLSEITDLSNNKIKVTYNSNNLISKIVDANDAEINITYEANKISIISPDKTVYMNINNDRIINIVTLTGTTIFSYNDKNIISIITDENGKKIAYEYYGTIPYRVKKVLEYGIENTLGQYFNIEYNFNSTTIIDNKDRIFTMTFNNNGNLISTINSESKNDIKNAYGNNYIYGKEVESANGTSTRYKNKLLNVDVTNRYVKNYLINTSFEKDKIYFAHPTTVDLSITDEVAEYGLKSLKAQSNDDNEFLYWYKEVPTGKHYTFSAYIKNSGNVRIGLEYLNSDNKVYKMISDTIYPNETFERYDVTVDYETNPSSDLLIKIYLDTAGTTYIDGIQLEEGEVANNYNMLENSDFSDGLGDWTLDARDNNTLEEISTDNVFEIVSINEQGDKALKVKMNPAERSSFEKEFEVNGKGGETYNISFWYKNEAFPTTGLEGDDVYNDLTLFFYYNDTSSGHGLNGCTMNPNDNEWQFFSKSFTAEKDFSKFSLSFYQARNANNCYITNLYLFRDSRSVIYDYDENGNVIATSGLNDSVSKFNYDKNNQLTQMLNPKGKNFRFEYDNTVTDRVINGINDLGISNQIKYDEFNNPILTRIQKNNISSLIDGLYKVRLKGTDKYLRNINNSISVLNDGCSHDLWKLEKVDEYYKICHSIIENKYLTVKNSKIILSNYDNDNSLFTLNKNKNGSYSVKQKETNNYIKFNNNLLEISNLVTDDYHFEFYFETIDSDLFIENSAEYTEDGKFIKSTTDTLFNKITYGIDSTTGLINKITNSKNQETNYSYDEKKRLTNVSTGNKSVSYGYNSQNKLDTITQGNKTYKFVYDEFLNTRQVKIGNNITLVTNNYEDGNGKLISSTYGNNQTINYTYDEFDRISKIIKMNDTYNYKYNNNGNLAKIISNNENIKYTYDLAKRLSEYKVNDFKINYLYDINDNIINTKYRLGNINNNIENTYDDDDSIIKTKFNDKEINYEYDSLGRLISSNINNQFNTSYEYVTNGNRTSYLIESIKNDENLYSYRYDKLNNITHIYCNNKLENKYYYDEYNQLIKEKNYLTNELIEYVYDNSGNILSKKIYDLNNNSFIKEDKYEYNNSNWEDQLTKFNDETITYDEIGNPLTIENDITLSWVNGRQLNTYTDSNKTIEYKYNKDGIRTSKKINNIETKYYLEGSNIILEKTGNDVLYYIRNSADGLIGFKYNENLYYYVKNIQNDIIGILDSNHEIVVKYTYDSWGNVASILDGNENDISNNENHIGNINPFRYRSYYYDKETKLYYLNSRYYNPMWNRFLNIDIGIANIGEINGYNMYQYSLNNPINYDDYNGNWPKIKVPKWLKKAAAVVAIAVVTVVTVAAVVASAPAVASFASTAALYYGSTIAVAKTVSTIATIGCTAVATSVAVSGTNRVVEQVTGKNYGAKILGEDNYETFETVTNVAATSIVSVPQYTKYPSTGDGPSNLNEQLAIQSAQSNPYGGEVIINYLKDSRMPGWLGWQKYQYNTNNISVHYVGNKIIPFFFDFKINK